MYADILVLQSPADRSDPANLLGSWSQNRIEWLKLIILVVGDVLGFWRLGSLTVVHSAEGANRFMESRQRGGDTRIYVRNGCGAIPIYKIQET